MINVLIRNIDEGVHALIKSRAECAGSTVTVEFNKALAWWVGDSQLAAVCRENEELRRQLDGYKLILENVRIAIQ